MHFTNKMRLRNKIGGPALSSYSRSITVLRLLVTVSHKLSVLLPVRRQSQEISDMTTPKENHFVIITYIQKQFFTIRLINMEGRGTRIYFYHCDLRTLVKAADVAVGSTPNIHEIMTQA
jgi:hypothetical protein